MVGVLFRVPIAEHAFFDDHAERVDNVQRDGDRLSRFAHHVFRRCLTADDDESIALVRSALHVLTDAIAVDDRCSCVASFDVAHAEGHSKVAVGRSL